jgi:membrane protein involved in colicin uptake
MPRAALRLTPRWVRCISSVWQERNQRKAEESAEKVQRAAEQRVKMTETQRQAYSERTRAQQQRMAAQKMQQEQRIGEIRAAADIKMQARARRALPRRCAGRRAAAPSSLEPSVARERTRRPPSAGAEPRRC